jgi:RHS repeat-associated protein
MEGSWQTQVGPESAYLYNGKELNEDFDLNWYDYGARWYDAAVGRWWSVDPLSDANLNLSAYNYVENNPLNMIDPTGLTGQMVGADDLTNEEWLIASRNGGNGVNDASKAKREDKNKKDKHDLPVVYYANPAKIKTSTLVSILNYASEIWAKNGFSHLKFIQVSINDAKKFTESYSNQAFIAFINQSTYVYDKNNNLSKTVIPGISRINSNGTIGVYNEKEPDEFDIAWLSWVNIARQKGYKNTDYANGYILAHEILHQFLGIASYYKFGDPYKKYYHHTEGEVGYNLNYPGESVQIPSGPTKHLQTAERILSWHKELLNETFKH